eukprot:6516056-Prymnesium_polylepis.1
MRCLTSDPQPSQAQVQRRKAGQEGPGPSWNSHGVYNLFGIITARGVCAQLEPSPARAHHCATC